MPFKIRMRAASFVFASVLPALPLVVAAQEQSIISSFPDDFDASVVGFQIGMTEAAAQPAMDKYIARIETDSSVYEDIYPYHSQAETGGGLYALYRRFAYQNSPAPTLEAVRDALLGKYGNPSLADARYGQLSLIYTFKDGAQFGLTAGKISELLADPDNISLNEAEYAEYARVRNCPTRLADYRQGVHDFVPASIAHAMQTSGCDAFLYVNVVVIKSRVAAIDTWLVDMGLHYDHLEEYRIQREAEIAAEESDQPTGAAPEL